MGLGNFRFYLRISSWLYDSRLFRTYVLHALGMKLSNQQTKVLTFLTKGYSNQEIADAMHLHQRLPSARLARMRCIDHFKILRLAK